MEYKWKRPNVQELILSVQENPCLYNVRSIEYLDRTKKAMAFNQIHKQLSEGMPGLTLGDVKKRWTNLRNQYMRELRLIKYSKKGGRGRNEVYQPKLWCFEHLSFLGAHNTSRNSADNIETEGNSTSSTEIFETQVTSSSTRMEISNEEQIAKRPKNTTAFTEKIQSRKNSLSYSWLGSLVTRRMEDIPQEKKEKVAWEIQLLLHKNIESSCRTTSESSTSSTKDLLQLSTDAVFEEGDFDD